MGYGVNAPTKYAKEYTEVEQAIRAVTGPGATEALTIISKLTKNVYQNPKEEKFRKIRLSNPKIDATIVQVPGAMQLLIAMGWKYDVDVDADNLFLPATVKLNFQVHARPCEERVEELAKENEKAFMKAACGPKPSNSSSNSNSNTMDISVRAQLEADRKERANADPITRSSVATARGSGTQVGCGDVGIGCESGG